MNGPCGIRDRRWARPLAISVSPTAAPMTKPAISPTRAEPSPIAPSVRPRTGASATSPSPMPRPVVASQMAPYTASQSPAPARAGQAVDHTVATGSTSVTIPSRSHCAPRTSKASTPVTVVTENGSRWCSRSIRARARPAPLTMRKTSKIGSTGSRSATSTKRSADPRLHGGVANRDRGRAVQAASTQDQPREHGDVVALAPGWARPGTPNQGGRSRARPEPGAPPR